MTETRQDTPARPRLVREPPDWMRSSAALKVMKAIEGDRPDRPSRYVGGCVRNWIMGRDVHDIDIATLFVPDEVTALLERAGIEWKPTGLAHGTVTALCETIPFEITTLRQDVETYGRHAKVVFGTDWKEDAKRRDFTMNALYADMDGGVYDFLELGLEDTQNRYVRFIGDPAARIREDYLRILRYFRFQAIYGAYTPDRRVLDICAGLADGLDGLAEERITAEMDKLIMGKRAVETLELLSDRAILPDLFAHQPEWAALERLTDFQQDFSRTERAARYVLWMGDVQAQSRVFSRYLKFSKALWHDIHSRAECAGRINLVQGAAHDLRYALYTYDRDAAVQALMIQAARQDCAKDSLKAQLNFLETADRPVFPVKGADLHQYGFQQGRALGEALARLEALWMESGFELDRDELLERLNT